jgi:hypothetical protein
MESTLSNKLKSQLSTLKAKGEDVVSISGLLEFLEQQQFNSNDSIEIQKIENQRTLVHLDIHSKHRIEMFKAVIESGREALNALVLINGGAVVALLGFMGAIISKALPPTLGQSLTIPLLLFGIGVLTGGIGFATRYFSQALFAKDNIFWGDFSKYLAVVIAMAGYILFGIGIYWAYSAFSTHFLR